MDNAANDNCDELWDMFQQLKSELKDDIDKDDENVQEKNDNAEACTTMCANPMCKSTDIILEEGNYICKECGTLSERYIDFNAEWRFYGSEDSKGSDPTRCGMPMNDYLPGMSLGSVIGNERSGKFSHYIPRISKYQKWNSMSYKERNLYNIIENIRLKAANGLISHVIVEDAIMLYTKISEMKISRGENREGLIASSVYMSCKKNKVPRSAKEIAKMFNLNITAMTRGCKKFHDIMKMNIKNTTTPDDFILRFCSKLDMSEHMVDLCRYVVQKEEEYAIISENAPPSIAAGCIYLVNVCCQLGRSKREISSACDISEITINKCFKKLNEVKRHLFPDDVVVKYNITDAPPSRSKRQPKETV